MREIKFRGVAIIVGELNGKFIYGDLKQEDNDIYNIYDRKLNGYIQVIPSTIGQFTGIHDKNGVEIYEGDIIQELGLRETWTLSRRDEFSNRKHVVLWNKEELQFSGSLIDDNLNLRDLGLLNEKYVLEVIGNIHKGVEE